MEKENKKRSRDKAPEKCVIDIIPSIIGRLKSMAHYYYSSRDDALDLVQDTILRLLENVEQVDSREDLLYIALTTMRRIRYNDWRHEGLISWIHLDDDDDYGFVDGDAVVDARLLLERIYSEAEFDVKVDAVVKAGEGYSQREIASMQGVPVGTVFSRVSYGKKKLLQMA